SYSLMPIFSIGLVCCSGIPDGDEERTCTSSLYIFEYNEVQGSRRKALSEFIAFLGRGAFRCSVRRCTLFADARKWCRSRSIKLSGITREVVMLDRSSTTAASLALVAALMMAVAGAQAADDPMYPDWEGAWMRIPVRLPTQPSHDQTKPWGRGQQAPLTPEYQKVLEDSIADQAVGGLGNFPTTLGRAAGMPHMMMGFGPLEGVVTPPTAYILIGWHYHHRRIFTDGRDWPLEIEPTFAGYSIGKWVDTDGDGAYDTLEVETRGFKGPRAYDEAGLPLHF